MESPSNEPSGASSPDSDAKIFAIGLSRTGTLSLTNALTALGFRAVHYPNDPVTQEELRAGRYALTLLREVQAITDIPVAPFYAQFDRAFPNGKFILTTRRTGHGLRPSSTTSVCT